MSKKSAEITAAAHTNVSISMRQRHNFAVPHLMAAANFARISRRLEDEHRGENLGNFFDEIRWNVSAAVIMSMSALEANLNELLEDVGVGPELLELIERRRFFDRYRYSLWFLGKEPIEMGKEPAQAVNLLRRLRDELIHPHPEWDDRQGRHGKLGDQLTGAFSLSPFVSEGSARVFPMRVMSFGCASWAVTSACAFGDDISNRIKGETKFQQVRKFLQAPA